MRVNSILAALAPGLVFFLAACDLLEKVPPGRIKVKNDFGGDKYSTVEVSARGVRYVLKARQSVLLPKGSSIIHFGYQGPKEYREYSVECPDNPQKGILIKLIDVDSGRIAGGCRTAWLEKRPSR